MLKMIKTFGKLKIGDVIWFDGVNLKVVNIHREQYTGEMFLGKCKEYIYFETIPVDEKRVGTIENCFSGYDFVQVVYTPKFG